MNRFVVFLALVFCIPAVRGVYVRKTDSVLRAAMKKIDSLESMDFKKFCHSSADWATLEGRPTDFDLATVCRDGEEDENFVGQGSGGSVCKIKFFGSDAAMKVVMINEEEEEDEEASMVSSINAELFYFLKMNVKAPENVPKFFDCIYDDKRFYMISELFDTSLRKYMLLEFLPKMTPIEKIYPTFKAMATVVEGLHNKDFIHNDIKGANFVCNLDEKGLPTKIRIIDFELAEFFESSQSSGGTDGFIAPEKVNESESSYETDVYALGMTFFEMLYVDVFESAQCFDDEVFTAECHMAQVAYMRGKFMESPEVQVRHEDFSEEEPDNIQELILWMTDYDAEKRPSLESVIEVLDSLMAHAEEEERILI